MRGIILGVFVATMGILPCRANVAQSCPGSMPVSSFKLLVEPRGGGLALPLSSVNLIALGDKLKYEPVNLPANMKGKARVAVLLAPLATDTSGHIDVLEVKPANAAAEWRVPMNAAEVGLVFGPHGLDVHKIDSFVKKNPDLVFKLSDYVEQTSKVEALVQTLSKYEQSAPGSTNLQSMLNHFSSQYGVALPTLSANMPADQQAAQLLRAMLPAFSATDPPARPTISQQSASLAASVATFFFGPQALLAAGSAGLFAELHATFFPRAEFRSAFAEPVPSNGMNLCTGKQPAQSTSHVRIAYLWMLPIPDAPPPSVSLPKPAHIPTRWISTIDVSCASVSEMRLLTRARDWHLVSPTKDIAISLKVNVGPEVDSLVLDLTHVELPPGQYHLEAKWDWTPLVVRGAIDVLNFADYSRVRLSPYTEDHLVAGNGLVPLELTGADFEFLNNVTLINSKNRATLTRVSYNLSDEGQASSLKALTANIDASHLQCGSYFLRLRQINGQTHDVPVTVHPPNPTLDHLPLRINLGQPEQIVNLRGTGLDRIEKITSPDASWTLGPAAPQTTGMSERQATLKIKPKTPKGARISAKIFVAGIQEPLDVPDVLEVVGPRPKIVSVRKSFASETSVALRDGEIPANSAVSFAIDAQNIASRSKLHLACGAPDDTKRDLTMTPGERDGANQLDLAGEHSLFLSLNPGDVGQSGCLLMATVTDEVTGTSDPYALGRIVRLPRIDKFTVTDESLGASLYAGLLTGDDLQAITMTGWDAQHGIPVQNIPTPVPGEPQRQTLKITMSWPPPSPHAMLYIWLSDQTEGRATNVRY
ncbi:MAG: hypothetical protein WBD73_12465 [Candidatus Acidiferrales bacterium]